MNTLALAEAALKMATAIGLFAPGNGGPSGIEKVNAFVASENGNKFIAALDQALGALGVNIVIAIRGK